MKLKEKIYLSMQNIKTHKKAVVLTSIITTILLFIIILAFTIMFMVNQTINNLIYDSLSARNYTLVSNYSFEKGDILKEYAKNIDHVLDIYDVNKESSIEVRVLPNQIINKNWTIELFGRSNSTLPKIVFGKNFQNENSNVAICPLRLLMTGVDDEYFISKKDYVDGKKLLGQTIIIEYDEYFYKSALGKGEIINQYQESFKVVGLYDNTTFMSDDICFVHYSDIKRITETQNGNLEEYNTPSQYVTFNIAIDSNTNLSYIKEQLNDFAKNNNIAIDLIATITPDTELISSVTTSVLVACTISLFLFLICFIIYTVKNIESRKREIGLYKAMGYKNKQIYDIVLIEQFIITTLSFIMAIILLFFCVIIFKLIAKNYFYILLKFSINMPFLYFVVIYILIIILTYFISLLDLRKISKVEATVIMND